MNVMVMRYLFFCTWYKKRETFWYQLKKEQLFMHPSIVLNNNKTHKEEEYDKNQNYLSAFLLSSHKSRQELLILFYLLLNVHAACACSNVAIFFKILFFPFIYSFVYSGASSVAATQNTCPCSFLPDVSVSRTIK